MTMQKMRLRSLCYLLLVCAFLLESGCGGGAQKNVPVLGKVTLNGKPLTVGRVSFIPDSEKGNNANIACLGEIGSEGKYELAVRGAKPTERGVPLGWYKVIYLAPKNTSTKVDPSFLSGLTTPLAIEVVPDPQPDQYDILLQGNN